MTRVYFVRHGETDWNRERRLQGARDVPINARGTEQARMLAQYFSTRSIDVVLTSPLARAWTTAKMLADACRCPLVTDARLREVDHGMWTGRTLPEIAAEDPTLVAGEQLEPEAFAVSGGETLSDVFARVSRVLADLVATRDRQSIVVVSHGVALALIACAVSGADPADYRHRMPSNGDIVALTLGRIPLQLERSQ